MNWFVVVDAITRIAAILIWLAIGTGLVLLVLWMLGVIGR
jgi:hypothetical protein